MDKLIIGTDINEALGTELANLLAYLNEHYLGAYKDLDVGAPSSYAHSSSLLN